MKRITLMSLCLMAGLSGCSVTDFVIPGTNQDKNSPKPAETARPSIRPPVTAGQINPSNAKDKAQALRDELERDQEHALDAADGKKLFDR